MKLVDFFCLKRRFLLYNLILRNLKIRYRRSFFGMVWTVLVPAASALIYHIVFHFVLKVQMENYLLHIFTGLIPWTFFATTITVGLELIVNNHGLLNKVPLPAHSLVLAEASTSLLNFILSLPVLVFLMVVSGHMPAAPFIQLIPLTVALFLITYSLALALALAFVYLRDLRYLTGIVLQFWFYLTPIMYKTEMIPEKYQVYRHLNPLFEVFDGFRESVVTATWISFESWLVIFGWTAVCLMFAFFLLTRLRKGLVEIL